MTGMTPKTAARPRLLFVVKHLRQGGTERQVLRMLHAATAAGFDCWLCTLEPGTDFADGPDRRRWHVITAPGRQGVAQLRALLEELRPDLVHSFRDVVNRMVWRALRGMAAPPRWLLSVRGRPMLPYDLFYTRRMQGDAHFITVNSVGVASALQRVGLIPARRMVVVPNLVDESACRPATASERIEARLRLGLSPTGFVWILPARLSWVKNQLGLVAALWLLRRRGLLRHDTVVVLAGRRRDRVAALLTRALTRVLGVGRHVRFLETMKDPTPLFAAGDALVLPSWAEGMPNVVLEAQLAGLPVVATHQANCDDLVVEGVSGYTVTTGSVPGLVRAMARMMAAGPRERDRLGDEGRRQVRARFRSETVAAHLAGVYRAAIGLGAAGLRGASAARAGELFVTPAAARNDVAVREPVAARRDSCSRTA